MKIDFEFGQLKHNEIFAKDYQKKIREINTNLHSPNNLVGTAWVDWPTNYNTKEFFKIQKLAKQIRESSDALIVIGIGGSYLGAKAGIEMLAKKSKVEIIFAGTSFDYYDLNLKLESVKNKDVTVNIISKSGSTIETLTAMNIVERFMKNKYKSSYTSRMIYTTSNNSYLYKKAVKEGGEILSIPENMGGRYSVLSAVGLLPFAVADIKIKKILEGAKKAQDDFNNENVAENIAYQYAIYRHIINYRMNKKVELFSTFHTQFSAFNYWIQQLLCESEGKDGEGLFVAPITYSTDLHSVGQFIQQGSPVIAETFINVENCLKDNTISNVPLGSPAKYLDGKTFSEINSAAFNGTVKAHSEAKVPICIITIDEINEYNFGYLVYFFELACSASGYLLKVNPFNQPGVEQYKSYMKEILKK